jgi:serine/threonine-protein kinase HipA
MGQCLYCYEVLENGETDFHTKCSKKLFGTNTAPILEYENSEIEKLALQVVSSHITVTGAQPKLSLSIEEKTKVSAPKKFTIVGMWGNYILKPPTAHYPELPEVEDLTMHLARIAKISTVPHSLIRMKSGELAYITKRIDRSNSGLVHMEDMCQITDRLSEQKYQGSYEQIAKAIKLHSSNPGLDIVNFFEMVVFSFLTGNADMHLKNFSLIQVERNSFVLSPAYDMVATQLVLPSDTEDLALNLNGKKKKIKKSDFIAAFNGANLEIKQQQNIFLKFEKAKDKWLAFIQKSFLSPTLKKAYIELINLRFERLTN